MQLSPDRAFYSCWPQNTLIFKDVMLFKSGFSGYTAMKMIGRDIRNAYSPKKKKNLGRTSIDSCCKVCDIPPKGYHVNPSHGERTAACKLLSLLLLLSGSWPKRLA